MVPQQIVALSGKRILTLDAIRGLVMVIMALDHARDFLHVDAMADSPTNLATTTLLLFFTRWITHLCAPTFVFLAGTSAWLTRQRLGDSFRLYLIKRGIWLILLEFTLVSFALWFDLRFRTQLFEVIGAIGFGFIVLGLVSRIPAGILGGFGIALIFLHNVSTLVPASQSSVIMNLVRPLFLMTPYPITSESVFLVAYPPLPWLGILLAGYAMAPLITKNTEAGRRMIWKVGLAVLALFVLLRVINKFGDLPWTQQPDAIFTFLSFMNVTKYPPSLQFTLSMLGAMLVILGLLPEKPTRFMTTLATYGSVPLFYFLTHLYLIHSLMILVLLAQGFLWSDMNFGMFGQGRPPGGGGGLPLWAVYCVWIDVVAAMYPVCRWYRGLCSRQPNSFISRYI